MDNGFNIRQVKADGIPWTLMLFGAAIYLAIQLSLVGWADIGGSSEAREAHVISEIVKNSEWVLPRRNGIIPSKPPLFHWIGALTSLGLNKVTELSVRLPSVLAGIFVVVCAGLCAFRLTSLIAVPSREVRPRHAFFIAAGILSLTYGFYQMTCQAMVDMVFCACVWGALTSLAWSDSELWLSRQRLSQRSLFGFWLFCSLSVLARGPVGPVLCIVLAGSAGLFSVGLRATIAGIFRPTFAWLLLGIPVVWYLCAYERGGEPFLERQLFFENVKRLTGGEHINEEAWWFYGPSLLRTTFPWGILALVFGISEVLRRGRVSAHPYERMVVALPLVLLCIGVVLFSIASGKRHSYLVPLMPLIALELAIVVSLAADRGAQRWRARFLTACRRARFVACAFAFAIFLAALFLVAGGYEVGPLTVRIRQGLASLMLPIGVAFVVGLMGAKLIRAHGAMRICFTLWGALFSVMAVIVASGSTLKARFKDFRSMAALIQEYNSAGRQLVVIKKDSYEEYFDPILFYLGEPVRVVLSSSDVFRCSQSELYLTDSSLLNDLIVEEGQQLVVLGIVREGRLRDQVSSGGGREVAVFRCQSVASDAIRKPAPFRTA